MAKQAQRPARFLVSLAERKADADDQMRPCVSRRRSSLRNCQRVRHALRSAPNEVLLGRPW